jgi:hypothetical protein
MADSDPRSEAELVAALLPALGQLPDALAQRNGQTRRFELRLGDRHRVVEEDHDPVAREVLERAPVSGDQLARRGVVLADHVDELLGLGGLRERREPAEVEEDDRDVRPVAGEELPALIARDQRGDRGREEPRELGLLALDCLEELRVRDCDRALVGERRHQLDLPVLKGMRIGARQPDDAKKVTAESDREPEQRPVSGNVDPGVGVVRVGADVRDVHRLPGHRDATRATVRPRLVRAVALVLDDLRRLPEVGPHAQEVSLAQIEEPGIRSAKPRRGFHYLVEDRLEAHARRAQGTEDVCHRIVPAAKLGELPGQLGDLRLVGNEVRHASER